MNKLIGGTLPVLVSHGSRKDGVLSIPSILDKRDTILRGMSQMMLSSNDKTRRIEKERSLRRIGRTDESHFLGTVEVYNCHDFGDFNKIYQNHNNSSSQQTNSKN